MSEPTCWVPVPHWDFEEVLHWRCVGTRTRRTGDCTDREGVGYGCGGGMCRSAGGVGCEGA